VLGAGIRLSWAGFIPVAAGRTSPDVEPCWAYQTWYEGDFPCETGSRVHEDTDGVGRGYKATVLKEFFAGTRPKNLTLIIGSTKADIASGRPTPGAAGRGEGKGRRLKETVHPPNGMDPSNSE